MHSAFEIINGSFPRQRVSYWGWWIQFQNNSHQHHITNSAGELHLSNDLYVNSSNRNAPFIWSSRLTMTATVALAKCTWVNVQVLPKSSRACGHGQTDDGCRITRKYNITIYVHDSIYTQDSICIHDYISIHDSILIHGVIYWSGNIVIETNKYSSARHNTTPTTQCNLIPVTNN